MYFKELLASLLGLSLLVATIPASGYARDTHDLLVQVAVSRMQVAGTWPDSPPIEDASQSDGDDWVAFKAAAIDSPERLGRLYTGLPFSPPRERPYSSVSRNTDFPLQAWVVVDEGRPFHTLEAAEKCLDEIDADPGDNLDEMGRFRIVDFDYFPEHSTPCGLRSVPVPDPEAGDKLVLQQVLGWHAAEPDYRYGDSVLWFRPANDAIGEFVSEVFDAIWVGAVGSVFVFLACLAGLVTGDGCDPDDAYEFADQINPVNWIESLIPGVGSIRDERYIGLWHHLHMDRAGTYNDPPGMDPLYAGPFEDSSAVDCTVVATSYLSGLSLNAGASDADNLYGQYDERGRDSSDWQRHPIGGTEFSSIDNLALYGWNKFQTDGGLSAEGLGWPLHAIADVTVPHHTVGSAGWGHAPYESFVRNHWDNELDSGDTEGILGLAFRRWQALNGGQGIQDYVTDIAASTRISVLEGDEDWAFKSGIDSDYHLCAHEEGSSTCGVGQAYLDELDQIGELVDSGVAGTIAFLVHTSGQVPDEVPIVPETHCNLTEEHYETSHGCVPGGVVTPQPEPEPAVIIDQDAGSDDCFECVLNVHCPSGSSCVGGCCRLHEAR